MLTHSNAFIPRMNEEERQCFDDYEGQAFTIDLQIAVRPGAMQAPDIRELENALYNLLFTCNKYGCISLDKSASFSLAVKSSKNRILYMTRHNPREEPQMTLWDERKLWPDLPDAYAIELSLEDCCGKTHDFWHWMEDSEASFWDDIEMKGFLHCSMDHAVACCFRKGGGQEDVFVSTLDIPAENAAWFDGTYEDDSMTADWFSMSIDVYSQSLWDKLVLPVFQIAALNRVSLRPDLSLLEKVTDAGSTEEAAALYAHHVICFYPRVEVGAGSKFLLEKAIREILHLLSKADANHYGAETYTGYFYNKKSLYLEIWDFNPDTFELVVSHTIPLNRPKETA